MQRSIFLASLICYGLCNFGFAQTPPSIAAKAKIDPRFDKIAPQPRKTIHLAELQQDYDIIGPLGRPIQEVMTVVIEFSPENRKGDALTMVNVLQVNGFALQQPIRMAASRWQWAKALPTFENGKRYELRAFQDLTYSGQLSEQALLENQVPPIQRGGHDMKAVLEIIGPVEKMNTAK